MFGDGRVVQGLLPQAVQRPLPRQGRRLRLGQGALQRGALRLEQVRRDARRLLDLRQGHRARPGTTPRWPPARRRREIKAYLAQFDKVDRYDYDSDGNFNEPDGYIDHFQAIHAGEGEEAGGGAQGADAIWSHRWYAYSNDAGTTGPARQQGSAASQIGDTGIWIGDYTTEPENGGLGVFAHEFGHDLGLPDLYDTAGGDNGTGFWTLMCGGSWLNHGDRLHRHHARLHGSVGEAPARLARLHDRALRHRHDRQAGPGRPGGETAPTRRSSSRCPERTVTTEHNTPHSGTAEWWSGVGDDLNTTLTRTVDLTGATSGVGHAWRPGRTRGRLRLPLRRGVDRRRRDAGPRSAAPIDGERSPWTQKTWDLTAYAGQNVQFRFRVRHRRRRDRARPSSTTSPSPSAARPRTDDVEAGAGALDREGLQHHQRHRRRAGPGHVPRREPASTSATTPP